MNLLGGLKQKRNTSAGQAAYGRAMANKANLNLSGEQNKSDFSAKKFAADQDNRMGQSKLNSSRSGDYANLRTKRAGLDSRKSVFDEQMKNAYDQLNKRKNVNFRQALINQTSRHFT
jgi:hypothetical protein